MASDNSEGIPESTPFSSVGGVSTKASFRAWISVEEDCLEDVDFGPGVEEAPIDEIVTFNKNFNDLSTLTAWQREEELKMTRKSSLTRQRPTSSLNTSDCLVEEILAASPFGFPQTPSGTQEPNISPFTGGLSDEKTFTDSGETESGYVMVPKGGETEKVSLRTRIMWKISKLRRRQAKKIAEYRK